MEPFRESETATLQRFMRYLQNAGIRFHLTLAASRTIFGLSPRAVQVAAEMLSFMIDELREAGKPWNNLDMARVASAAPSLQLLVNCAQNVEPSIIPRDAIPSRQMVERCLQEFHRVKKDSPTTD